MFVKEYFGLFIFLSFLPSTFAHFQNIVSDTNSVFIEDELVRINIYLNQASLDSLLSINESGTSEVLYNSSFEFISSNQEYTISNVGIRLRGNTSLTAPKKSFKLDFNAFIPGQKLLGVEKLNLNANQNDPSLFRAAISWYILRDMNLPSTRTSFAKLYINDDFMGVYVVT